MASVDEEIREDEIFHENRNRATDIILESERATHTINSPMTLNDSHRQENENLPTSPAHLSSSASINFQ